MNNVRMTRKEVLENPSPILGFEDSNQNSPNISHVHSDEVVKETPEGVNMISSVAADGNVQGKYMNQGKVISNSIKKDLNFLHKNGSDIIEEEIEDSVSTSQNQIHADDEFEVVLSKSKKRRIRQKNKKVVLTAGYNTRSRADSRSPSL